MAPIVYFNGAFLPKNEVHLSPDDRGFLFADGVYEVARSYEGRLFELDAHMRRLATGLCELQIVGLDVPAVTLVLGELLRRNDLLRGQATVYVQVTRGAAPRIHAFPDPPVPPTVYAEARPFVRRADPAQGVAVITVPDVRWARCDIKSVSLLPNVLANQRARAAGAIEALFVRDGVVLEGSNTAFLAVIEGEVRTAPNSNYILPSVSRDVVLRLCAREGIRHRETAVFADDLARADELFLASTTLEVMPVVRVDGRPVGDGRPGPMTTRLGALFSAETTRARRA
jgi:D-alanine transaminase